MKRFINNILILSVLVLISLIGVTIVNKLLFNYFKPFSFDDNINVLILGDSHARFAFNDSVLVNAINLSNSADSYFYSYQKLKKVLDVNKSIDTVFLAFGEHNVNKSIEERWLLNDLHLKQRLRLYFPLLDVEDLVFIAKYKPIELLLGTFNQLYFPMYVQMGTKRFGGYVDVYGNILDRKDDIFEEQEYLSENLFVEADIEISYLFKIIELCKLNNIEIILVNTPIYKVLHDHQGHLFKTYNRYFSDIPFYDYSTMELSDSCFTDLVHLNKKGAIVFSEKFNKQDELIFQNNRYIYNKVKY